MNKLKSISVVMPVHNEQAYLRFSLPFLKKIEKQINEFVFVLDRCTDHSEQIIKKAFPNAKIFHKTVQKWVNPCAESFQYGFDRAHGNIIWALGADLILDPNIPSIIRTRFDNPKVGTLCFRYFNYDLFNMRLRLHGFYDNLYRNVIQHFRRETRHSGFYAFRKEMTDSIGGLKDVPSEYDEFARRIRKSKWRYVYVPYTSTLHLRVGLTKNRQFQQGRARYYLPQYNLAKTFFHSLVHFKPYLIKGYLHERRINE